MPALPELIHAVGFEKNKAPFMKAWNGRIMKQYALCFVSKGNGFFENLHGQCFPVPPGTAMFQPPGLWHCNDPHEGTLWDEYWVMLDDTEARRRFGSSLLPEQPSVYSTGPSPIITECFNRVKGRSESAATAGARRDENSYEERASHSL